MRANSARKNHTRSQSSLRTKASLIRSVMGRGNGRTKKTAWLCPHIKLEHCAHGLCESCYRAENKEHRNTLRRAQHCKIKKELGPDFKRWNKARRIKVRYGITIARWDEIFTEQNGKCICGKIFSLDTKTNAPHLDHDHACCPGNACGKCVRGMLCFRCNSVLGFLEKEPHLLPEYLREYLRHHALS